MSASGWVGSDTRRAPSGKPGSKFSASIVSRLTDGWGLRRACPIARVGGGERTTPAAPDGPARSGGDAHPDE
ncbi:MAG TPA: hypothetical protein PKA64_23080, partial [Myxococcota bacterium]|nr:hypothetical protein [Myxococcota bacterium]